MRWELLDNFDFLKKHSRAVARKAYSGKEDFFSEHTPGRPRVPEPLFLEMIAQTGGVLYGLGLDFKKEVILAKITQAKFGSPVAPPCEFTVEARIRDEREEGALIWGAVKCKGVEVASAEILLVAVEAGTLAGRGKIVFNDTFMTHFKIYEVAERSEKEKVSP